MALAQYTGDEGIGQRGQVSQSSARHSVSGSSSVSASSQSRHSSQQDFPDVGFQQGLPFVTAQDAGHPGKAGRVAVLLVDGQAVFLAGGVEIIHPPAVLSVIRRVDPHDGV